MNHEHWTCLYPDNRPSTLQAQWLAAKEEDGKWRYMEANCADIMVSEIPAGEYKRGGSFDIVPQEWAITENDSEERKEAAKQRGFERIQMIIDEINASVVSQL